MTYRIKGRNWWGKRPKNSWSAKNKMHSILKAMLNGITYFTDQIVTHGLGYERLDDK